MNTGDAPTQGRRSKGAPHAPIKRVASVPRRAAFKSGPGPGARCRVGG